MRITFVFKATENFPLISAVANTCAYLFETQYSGRAKLKYDFM